MAIDNAQAIQFGIEYARPLAEALRALQHRINNALSEWPAVSAEFGNAPEETVADAHAATRPITGAAVTTTMGRLSEVVAVLNAQYAMDSVLPLCVRPLEVTV